MITIPYPVLLLTSLILIILRPAVKLIYIVGQTIRYNQLHI